jgi:hypothetical protein
MRKLSRGGLVGVRLEERPCTIAPACKMLALKCIVSLAATADEIYLHFIEFNQP